MGTAPAALVSKAVHAKEVSIYLLIVFVDPDGAAFALTPFRSASLYRLGCRLLLRFFFQFPVTCATTLTVVPDKTLAANIQLSGSGVLGQEDSDLSNTPQCSGHGLCKTMREMGNEFNG